MNARTLTLSLALGLAACGGAEEPEDTNPEVTAQATSGEEDTSEASITPPPGRMSEVLTALAGDPLLTVYVDGPLLVDDGPYASGEPVTVETNVYVHNRGTQSAAIDQAQVKFAVYSSEDDSRVDCSSVDDTGPPEAVHDDSMVSFRGVARCTFPASGEYEVHTYVSFAAGELDGDFDIERHYAGRIEVEAQ
ncbi:MAG: hypothetical protein SangKO_036140 [Sandaracinaceae bacterium]